MELVPVEVLEDRRRAPRLGLRRLHELHAFPLRLLVMLLHVIPPERDRLERADPIFVSRRREQDYARLRAGNAQLEPTLLAEGLVGHDLEAELFGVELQRLLLVAYGDAGEL